MPRTNHSDNPLAIENLEPRTLLSAAGLEHRPDHATAHVAAHGNVTSLAPSEAPGFAIAVQPTGTEAFFSSKKIGLPEFDADNFDAPVANPWFPLVPGTTYVYEAEEEDGLIITTFSVTHETKEVLGVTTIVVRETEEIYVEELDQTFLLEDTFDWYAMDNWGNVWYFGEDTTAYEYDDDWNLIGTDNEGAWEAGVDGALPGILILADPSPGASYQQEFLEGEAEDRAKVLRLNARISIEFGDFEDVLVTKEWNTLEPGSVEHKYYAYGVGLIYVEELSGGPTVKVELVEMTGP